MSTPNATQDGGYAVVFRDPYGADKAATTSSSDSAIARIDLPGSQEQDGISVGDFTIRHWLSHRTFGAAHVEMAALAQALEEVIKRNDQHRPDKSTVKIFTDSDTALARIDRGILNLETNTFANSLKRKRENKAFFEEHTNPFVRLIVWQSHYLSDRGCTIEMNWMPRNTTLGHSLADHMAGKWKNWRGKDPGDAFNQNYLPRDERDGIMDKLHEEVSAIERARTYDVLDPEPEEEPKPKQAQPPKKERRIKLATGAKKRSTTERIALLDSPSDYIPLDSESEEKLASQSQPQKKKQKVEGTIKAQKRSTTDFILLDSDTDEEPQRPKKRRRVRRARVKKTSAEAHTAPDGSSDYTPLDSDSEQKPKPKPQPPKKQQETKGATTVKQRSTSDFILLDSDSEEQPKPKQPQTPKRRKKIRGAIPVKKGASMQQVEEDRLLNGEDNATSADGLLHGEDHAFAFDLGNLPVYPNEEHAIHDPDSGHGTPSCLLCACQDNDYP
ncbi:hypothetical protein NEUTE1DRAFT_51016 [Neurospora tetrasperma FGSC 2508]|uniref:RNase H type-1 domain-containing protein n=1 Tax=Neurospora tetrasperma (strain FGSC 2508 / ATCC MYA-4615 / P0657) TaxID=510951 RepID=F8MYK7_NEUT8|nr:uncharacterized protein NEUTE1DRAFT_51016 [Neurospora tetrasperma FGSC 2508]EGO51404.1 hypothetical protein NEUTE1DRAFT_51016 [Neurospora tetrasperma FGSC 2508]EGZ78624.1 hypothetical protein NEUTE2DRAFT_48956 [Neurospora tetrasperma FGSC 2509]